MEILGEIQKNKQEKLIVSISEYKAHTYIDIRVYYEDKKTGEYKPTKKGVALPPSIIREVMELVLEGAEKLQNDQQILKQNV